ncbi:MAG: Hsp70 family protein [Holophagales bacterium]|jgi:molecular chaperone DnaK (HSP70)|nr:Hsp70 family protein [Holophagales bacterium]
MAKVYGIDLGTTYSVIATLDENGTPEVIENYADSVQLLASAVYFPSGGDPVVGKEAKNQAEVEPDRVVQFVKREIGKPNAQTWDFDGVKYDPISISALILKRMKEYAEEQGHDVNDVVITCPAYFGNEERAATKQAGIIAGLNVLNIVNEPTAAALNYCLREFRESRKIMVYDLGGGTFDITLFDFSVDDSGKASIDVIETNGNDRLGGIDWDARLYDYICKLYYDENGVTKDEMDAELRQKIRSQVEDVKKSISSMPSKSFTISYAGDATRLEVTREKFEEQTQDLVEQTMDFVRQLLKEAKHSADDVDVVLLVGGSTRMPMIKAAVEGLFRKVLVEQPDLAVAKGAALAAANVWNERVAKRRDGQEVDFASTQGESGVTLPPITEEEAAGLMINVPQQVSAVNDKLTRSLGPAVFVDDNQYMIDNLLFIGDEMPAEATATYGTQNANQAEIKVVVFENVSRDKANNYVTPSLDKNGNEQYTDPSLKVKKIGDVRLKLPPNTPKGSPIEVFFRSSTIGLEVRATNLETNESAETVITTENTKTREELNEARERFASVRTRGQI